MKKLSQILFIFFVCIFLSMPVFSATLKDLHHYGDKIEHDTFYDAVCATGWIMNNSDEDLTITVKVNLYDKNNQYIETKVARDTIPAHILWRFVTEPIDKRAYSMKVTNISIN